MQFLDVSIFFFQGVLLSVVKLLGKYLAEVFRNITCTNKISYGADPVFGRF